MPRLEVEVRRSVAPASGPLPKDGPLLEKVVFRVSVAEGIDASLFVYRVYKAEFSHVAAPVDLANYPTTRDMALELLLGFYRQETAEIFVRIGTSDGLIERVSRRLRILLDAWAATGPDPSVMTISMEKI